MQFMYLWSHAKIVLKKLWPDYIKAASSCLTHTIFYIYRCMYTATTNIISLVEKRTAENKGAHSSIMWLHYQLYIYIYIFTIYAQQTGSSYSAKRVMRFPLWWWKKSNDSDARLYFQNPFHIFLFDVKKIFIAHILQFIFIKLWKIWILKRKMDRK